MKTGLQGAEIAAPIVALVDVEQHDDDATPVVRARAFAEPLLSGQLLDTGEEAMGHADGVAAILAAIGAAPSMQAAAYLVYAGDYLNKPEEIVAKAFGASYASLVMHTRKLVQIQRAAREARRSSTTRRSREKASSILRTRSVCSTRCSPPKEPCASRAARWICTSLRVCITRLA